MVFSAIYQSIYKKRGFIELNFPSKIFWYLLIIAPPVFISTIRYGVGTDYFNYISQFQIIKNSPLNTISWDEPLSFLLYKFSYWLFNSEIGFFFLSAFIIHLFVVMGIDFFKRDLSMPLALFAYYIMIFNFGLNGIRQSIAMSIVFFSFRYLIKKNFIKYLIFIFIATLFHKTAIICLIFYLIAMGEKQIISNTRKIVYYGAILTTPFLVLYLIKMFMNVPIFEGYTRYIHSLDTKIGFWTLIEIIPVILPFFLFRKSISSVNDSYRKLIDLSLLNIPFFYTAYYIQWGSRLAFYTNYFYLILVPILIKSIKSRDLKFILWIYYMIYFLTLYIVNYLIKNEERVFPYHTIFW